MRLGSLDGEGSHKDTEIEAAFFGLKIPKIPPDSFEMAKQWHYETAEAFQKARGAILYVVIK